MKNLIALCMMGFIQTSAIKFFMHTSMEQKKVNVNSN